MVYDYIIPGGESESMAIMRFAELFDFINYDLERDGDKVLCEAESAFWEVTDIEDSCTGSAPWYIEYEDCKFLFETEVVVEGAIGFDFFRNLYISIKGCCGKKYSDIAHNYRGYCLGTIPPCNTEKVIDTYSYTAK